MRVLVTGGAGFIGSHVVDRLVQRGDDVVVLDNLDPQVHGPHAGEPKNILGHVQAGRVAFHHGDIRDMDAVQRALVDVDAVIHLAATVGVGQSMYAPHYYTSTNVDGQGVLHEAMLPELPRIRRFVVASSMSIYGEGAYRCPTHDVVYPSWRDEADLARSEWEVKCPHCGEVLVPLPTDENKPLQFSSIYAITKKTQEELALCFGRAYRLPTLALRFFNVYGSRQALSNPYTGVAAIFMSRLKAGNAPLVFEDGLQSRDFIHVSDVARGVVMALDADPAISGAYNLCTGRPTTVLDVANALARLMGRAIPAEIVGKYRAGDIRHCFGGPSRTVRDLGFRAEVGLDEGFAELLGWSEDAFSEDKVADAVEELVRAGLVR